MEIPKWTWHYDPALNSLVLIARSSFRLYVFFRWPFNVLVTNEHFNPMYPFDDLALHLPHPVNFPAPTPSASSMETDSSMESLPCTILVTAETSSSIAGRDDVREI